MMKDELTHWYLCNHIAVNAVLFTRDADTVTCKECLAQMVAEGIRFKPKPAEPEIDEEPAIEQFVEFKMVDGHDWTIYLSVADTAKILDTFHSDEYDTIKVGISNPERQWHLWKANISGIQVINAEDVEEVSSEGSRSRTTPAKSRRSSG